ncbi:MAG: hypothetical protein KatS3mg104_1797 [Phycisphaerae bacterium]|jgi:hypothetical protein|nr:MAG: hypothetical protein KatS3mg104_1797 [Phycisphaerae bacterium]
MLPIVLSDPKFPLGHLVITQNALDVLDETSVAECVARHAAGDWGELCEADRRENERALLCGLRLFSVYCDAAGRKLYVITEHDRSVTTVLLPEDY